MRESKKRNVDFTLDELAELAGLTRKQFTDRLNRVCELYSIDKRKLKVYPDEEDSIYFLPPDFAEFLMLLVKNVDKHPLYVRTAKRDNVYATKVANFNRAILKDIDEIVSQPIKEIMYKRLGHLVSEKIAYWANPMVDSLTKFLVTLVTMETEDVGAALSMFTKEIDKKTYSVYRGNYLKRYAIQENINAIREKPLSKKEEQYNHLLNDSNVSIDIIIATLVKFFLEDGNVSYIKEHGFQTTEQSIFEDFTWYKMIGLLNEKAEQAAIQLHQLGDNLSVEDERKIYYDYFIRDDDCAASYEYNKQIMEHQREAQKKWTPIDKRISVEDYVEPIKVNVKDTKKYIKNEIASHENAIMELKKKLQELESITDEEENSLAKEIQDSYVDYCREVDGGYKELREITDKFVGQALFEFLS